MRGNSGGGGGHTQRVRPKRELKIGTRSETGMNIKEMMLPSQLTWFTVMPNAVAAETTYGG